MAGWALGLALLLLFLALGVRAAVHLRRTGMTGLHGISGRPGSVEWLGGILFGVAIFGVGGVPGLVLAGGTHPLGWLDHDAVHAAGFALYAAGAALTLAAQEAMGASWRVGVDESERTDLVTRGPFRLVRNPIYTGLLVAAAGLALLSPAALAFADFALLLLSLEIQTRLVEEPHLLGAHGESYAGWAAGAGRFVPGLGRLRQPGAQ